MSVADERRRFHADESLAVYMLRLLPEYSDAKVVRTRDPEVIKTADVVVDVGGIYDPASHRYDHHQREFVDTFGEGFSTRLSSAGLVYKHFGERVVRQILGWHAAEDTPKVHLLFRKIYKDMIQAYDGIDNGVPAYPSDVKPAYKDATGISHRVSALNPWWNQPADDIDQRFMKAVEMAGSEFKERVRFLGLSWLPARTLVEDALHSRKDVHESGRIIVLDQFCPWKEHLQQIEEENKLTEKNHPFYIVYQDSSSQWRVQAVPVSPTSFESRKALPEPWRGIRDQALSTLTGIEGCVFVHAGGFIGGNLTKVGVTAVQAARGRMDG
ncbi:hypothetical protein HK105_205727 [Polyrhizophydium stewartii]|uniref:GAMM1 protein n=1 Tax=Polyrhizophydium stewartii TaxID=2732419 RepID=A0ABR4N5J5_9FUNG|nr:hypothetical protein HK105_000693 [Polyrhizophydium stewartii]